jgi:hypothetical protein
MADGIPCLNCGWYETEHLHLDSVPNKEARKRLKDKKMSLLRCVTKGNGYIPEDQTLANELALDAEKDKLEQAMRGRKSVILS